MSEKFEPKVIEDTGYCEKIQSDKKCSLCYFNRDMCCVFYLYTKAQQERLSAVMRNSEPPAKMTNGDGNE